MNTKGLLLSTVLICWILVWSGVAECYDMYADSSGNVLNLRINNTSSGFAMPGVVVKMTEKPSWMSSFSPESRNLGTITANGAGTASFSFNVNSNAQVGNNGKIRFEISATSGDLWNKDVDIRVVISNGVITGNVYGTTNVTVTATGPVTKSVLIESIGYRIENLPPGNYTITATKNEHKSHPLQEIKNVPAGGVVSGVNFTMFAKPVVPSLSSPGAGATVNTLRPDLDWEDVPGAEEYTVGISTDSTFSSWDSTTAICYSSNYSIWSLDDNTVYYWRVKAKNYAGESNWSIIKWFRVCLSGSISGTVDTGWNNLDRYRVTITATKSVAIGPPFIKFTTTNEMGEYTIGDLSPGIYTVTAFKMGYDSPSYNTVYVYAGDETWGIDFTLTLLSARAAIRLSAPSSSTIRNAPQYSRFAQAMRAKRLRSPELGTSTQPIEEVTPVLRTGLVNVVVETAMPLTDAPVLSYTPVVGGIPEKVVLTGNGSVWTGQIYVESVTPEGTATFEYYGVNEHGSSSTQIDSGQNFEVDTTVLPDENIDVSNRDGTSVELTKDVVDAPINIQITDPDQVQQRGVQLAPALASALSKRMAALEGTPLVEVSGATRHIEASIDGKGYRVSRANANFSFNIPYQDIDQDGIVDNTGISESSLKAFVVDERGQWQQSAVSTINTEQNRVMVSHNLFTTYFLAGVRAMTTVENIACYPNPWYRDRAEYVSIGFIPLNSSPEVYIYNVAGELIRGLRNDTIVESNQGYLEARWDGKNNAGEDVSYGIYIYVVKCKQGNRRGKIALIR